MEVLNDVYQKECIDRFITYNNIFEDALVDTEQHSTKIINVINSYYDYKNLMEVIRGVLHKKLWIENTGKAIYRNIWK